MSVVTRVRTLDPLTLGPALWLDDSGSDKSVWPDKSGFGRNAVQATTSAQPDIITNALNGKQVRRFNGTSHFMTQSFRGLLKNVSGCSLFVVARAVLSASQNVIFINLTQYNNSRVFLSANVPSAGFFSYGGRRLDLDAGDFNTGVGSFTTSAFFIACVDFRFYQAQKQLFLNGSSAHLDLSFQTSGNTENTDSSSIGSIIGAIPSGQDFLNGDIAEIIIYPYALTSYERQLVEGYLSYKYALPVA